MKNWLLIVLCVFFSSESIAQKNLLIKRNGYKSISNDLFDAYLVDFNSDGLSMKFFWQDREKKRYASIGRVIEEVNRSGQELIFATNAGIYDKAAAPQGLFVLEGKVWRDIDRCCGEGNFYLQPNGIFLLDKKGRASVIKTENYQNGGEVVYATQSGPMLLINGQYNTAFNPNSSNYRLRSGVGEMANNKVVFIISKRPVSFYQFAQIFKEVYACENALYLDGEISKMYCPELGRFDLGGNFGPIIGILK